MKKEQQAQLANHLKQLLHQRGLKATEVAKDIGLSSASLSRILNGKTAPTFPVMAALAEKLNVPLDSFVQPEGAAPSLGNQTLKATRHQPAGPDALTACFVLPNADLTPKEAAQLLENAARGIWAPCWVDKFIAPDTPQPTVTSAHQLGPKRLAVEMAFPTEFFEVGSVPSLLAVFSSCLTHTGAQLIDVQIPPLWLRTFQGAAAGIRGVRASLCKAGRPMTSCTLRPMSGLSPKLYGRVAYEALKGGTDFTADPTLLHSTPALPWRERYHYVADAMHAATNETGELKSHWVNVSAATVDDMMQRAERAKELDLKTVMVDVGTVGFAAVQQLSQWALENDMFVSAMGSRSLLNGALSEHAQAKLLRLAGADMASCGSPLRGSVVNRRYVMGVVHTLQNTAVHAQPECGVPYSQSYHTLKGTLPAVGGGHNEWHFAKLIDAIGDDMVIQCGGAIMGHPQGNAAGATAVRTAIDALVLARNEGHHIAVDGRMILENAGRYSGELRTALTTYDEGAFLFGVVQGHGAKANTPLEARVEKTEDDFKPKSNLVTFPGKKDGGDE